MSIKYFLIFFFVSILFLHPKPSCNLLHSGDVCFPSNLLVVFKGNSLFDQNVFILPETYFDLSVVFAISLILGYLGSKLVLNIWIKPVLLLLAWVLLLLSFFFLYLWLEKLGIFGGLIVSNVGAIE